MTLNDFTTVYPQATVLDSNKRVNYVHGLVLGVDEFQQEEFYLLEKDRLHNRSLHGYGTVCGLGIEQQGTSTGLEVKVNPGMAICANGQVVEVPRAQCAVIDDWLASHADEVLAQLGSPAATQLSLYLMLCYQECKTDVVPIPTGPCQSLEDSTAPSRIADDFSLSLELTAPTDILMPSSPAQPGESLLIHRFIELLRSIPVQSGGTLTAHEIKDWVKSLAESSPPMVPPVSSPALNGAIDPANASELYNAALLAWVTEVKRCPIGGCVETVPADPYDHCVFLAELQLDIAVVAGVPQLDPGTPMPLVINEQFRQYVLDMQILQSLQTWLHPSASGGASGSPMLPVRKRIALPATSAHGRQGAGEGVLLNRIPSIHFTAAGAGQVLFNLPIPDDINFNDGMQFRLIWGYQANTAIAFDWRVGAHFYAAGEAITDVDTVDISISEPATSQDSILITDFHNFDSAITLDSSKQFAALEVSVVDTGGSLAQLHLLQVEIEYTANSAGGIV